MSSNFRKHYVPQFYLNHFCNGKEKRYYYDKETKKTFETKHENIVVFKLFYDLKTDLDELDEKPKDQSLFQPLKNGSYLDLE